MPVFSGEKFEDFNLWLIHDHRSRNEAENALNNLKKCQGNLKMNSGRFDIIQLPDFRGDFNKVHRWLEDEIQHRKKDQNEKIFAVIILDRKTDYPNMKKAFTQNNIMT